MNGIEHGAAEGQKELADTEMSASLEHSNENNNIPNECNVPNGEAEVTENFPKSEKILLNPKVTITEEPCKKVAEVIKDTNGCNADIADNLPVEDHYNGNKASPNKELHVKNGNSETGEVNSEVEENVDSEQAQSLNAKKIEIYIEDISECNEALNEIESENNKLDTGKLAKKNDGSELQNQDKIKPNAEEEPNISQNHGNSADTAVSQCKLDKPEDCENKEEKAIEPADKVEIYNESKSDSDISIAKENKDKPKDFENKQEKSIEQGDKVEIDTKTKSDKDISVTKKNEDKPQDFENVQEKTIEQTDKMETDNEAKSDRDISITEENNDKLIDIENKEVKAIEQADKVKMDKETKSDRDKSITKENKNSHYETATKVTKVEINVNKGIEKMEISDEEIDSEEDSSDEPVDTVSLSEDSDQDNNKQMDSDIILIDDTPDKKTSGKRARSSSPEVEEVVEVSGPRRSGRIRTSKKIKCVDLDEINGESDVELVDVVDPLEQNKNKICSKQKSKKDKPITNSKEVAVDKSINLSAKEATPPTSILPSLTDDMFVVEAPSFIVPYVYEKPSIEPFREFVDKLGKQLEEEEAIKEKTRLEEERAEKERREKEKQERKEAGEDVDSGEENLSQETSELVKETPKKKNNRRKMAEDDDDSWNGSDDCSDDDVMSDSEKIEVIKESEDIDLLPDRLDGISSPKTPPKKTDSYFDCTLGNLFINIGLNLVQGYVQNDLMKLQTRKLNKEKKSGLSTKQTESTISSLMNNLKISTDTNKPYNFPLHKCKYCSFKTESKLVMDHHYEMPHMKNNLYVCNFCDFENRIPHEIMAHMETVHKVKGRLERPLAAHCCVNCPFEDAAKGKLARHVISCAKRYKPEVNCSPPLAWEPPAKIPKMMKSRTSLTSYPTLGRPVAPAGPGLLKNPLNANALGMFKGRPRAPLAVSVAPRQAPFPPGLRGNSLRPHASFINILQKRPPHQPSLSIMPLPRTMQPAQPSGKTSTFVICEICDGYIKDLEQLRNHMQWIHKVKIHPKMIYNRPPLNCQKCQFRFFTDQGLERHLLGAHGLVTSSMQEAANKTKDSGRCPVCGKVFQCRLLAHVSKDHSITLRPAHLSYKCTVCTMTFKLYKQFESHVYLSHRVVAKKAVGKDGEKPPQTPPQTPPQPSPASKASDARLKNLKLNNEITITPSSAKATSSKKK